MEKFQVPLILDRVVRLDKYVGDHTSYSRSQIQQLIDTKKLRCDGKEVKRNHKLRGGEFISFESPQEPPTTIIPEEMAIDIPFVHDDFLIVNKATGMVVHPGKGNWTGTLANGLVHYIQTDCGEALRPGIVHRIDKGTSGLLVVARNTETLHHFQNLFSTHDIERTYYALVWGVPELSGRIENFLGRHPRDRKKFAVLEEGKLAITYFERCEVGLLEQRKVSLIRCKLQTGRTHQIRVHMSNLGFPLVGDPIYGRKRQGPVSIKHIQHQLLHAFSLGFVDRQGVKYVFEQEFPSQFSELLLSLEIPVPSPIKKMSSKN